MILLQNPNFSSKKIKSHLISRNMPAPAAASASGFFFLVLLFLAYIINCSEASIVPKANESLVPVMEAGKMGMMMLNESRRKLGSFRICALCTCCGGAKGVCMPSPCCYAINCNIPNRPFGFCSFTPKTCNCFGCHL